jgi:hypothetical protein
MDGGAGFRSGRSETGRRGALPSPHAALWAGASLLLVVTACAAAPRPDEPSVSSVASVADLVLPFDAYKPTPEQRVLLANAQARLVARCMRRHGVSAAPPMVAVATDPAVVQAATRWRACMVKAGYAYPTAEAAIADIRWNLDQPTVTAEEKRTATADTRCKWESGLVAAWFAADSALQRQVVTGNPDRFAALRANLAGRLARASQVFQETR